MLFLKVIKELINEIITIILKHNKNDMICTGDWREVHKSDNFHRPGGPSEVPQNNNIRTDR